MSEAERLRAQALRVIRAGERADREGDYRSIGYAEMEAEDLIERARILEAAALRATTPEKP